MTVRIPVELGERRYDVHVGDIAPDAAAALLAAALGPVTGVALLVDGALAERAPRLSPLVAAIERRFGNAHRLDLAPGESCKSLAQIERTTEWLAETELDRKGAVVGVGGGAATDHAGFAAAIYLRGLPFATVPTTLLAMVDASVGGKTGVDLRAGKNLVGAFHQPKIVVADMGFLSSLPRRERAAGLAEVVKCGFIADPAILDILDAGGPELSATETLSLIERAVRVKAEVVAGDEREGGRRAILNFGHTVGHALEAASGYGLLHGEAVALGMVAALDLGAALGVGTPALAARARSVLTRLGLPVDYARRLDAAAIARLGVDKKRRGAAIRFVLCPELGRTQLYDIAPADIAARLAPKA
jgi:3-dehydroquinate synthase